MIRFCLHLLSLVTCHLTLAACLQAAEPLVLSDPNADHNFAAHVEYLADPDGSLTIDDVTSSEYADAFQPGERPPGWRPPTVVWLRIPILNKSATSDWLMVDWFIGSRSPISIYVQDDASEWTSSTTDGYSSPESRDVWSRYCALRVNIRPGNRRIVYIRCDFALLPPSTRIQFVSVTRLHKVERDANMAYGLYYGIMAAMCLYNLFLYFSLRDRAYLYYVLLIGFAVAWFARFNGLAQFYFQATPRLNVIFLVGSMGLVIIFARTFLNTKATYPSGHRIGSVLFISLAIFTTLGLFGIGAVFVSSAVTLSIWAYVLWLGVVTLRKGYRPARYFLLAWTGIVVAAFLINLNGMEILPVNFLTQHGFQIAHALEAILLSFALADRINLLRSQRAEQETAEREAQVRGRTASLQNRAVRMENEEDFETVLRSVTTDLQSSDIAFDTCSIDMIDDPVDTPSVTHFEQNGFHYTTYRLNPSGGLTREQISINAPFPDVVRSTVERFARGDIWTGRDADLGAITEVPIAHYGRLRITSSGRDRFESSEIETIQDFTRAISLGYARYLAFQEIQIHTMRKSAFLASMSHELRTPMNAIKGFTNLVLRRGSDELSEQGHYELTRVSQASDHLLAMINDLLDLSKLEAGQMVVNVQPFDVAEVIQACSRNAEPMVREGVELRLEIADNIGEAYTDRERVSQMLQSLLNNATRDTETGSITATGHRDGNNITLSVTDTGPGMATEDLPDLFDEYRIVPEASDAEYGAGLGLSITKRFAELLRGSLTVQSKIGEGSTFSITLPVEYHGVESRIQEN